eukprot:TRINITY_DN11290_c0_g1_i1.p1 TRINITY_DN11290_c0_g1~~TRINITY_DN11290_c0_g1_i1.p1  ORF type:complete len:329 (+),score=121.45 TRINITY_DN11290_c0_g1_i1:109-987(+)
MTASMKNTGYKLWTSSVAWALGPIKSTQFEENGKLTPEEFTEAGNMLVRSCPSWRWAAGDEKIQPRLPRDKKYLVLSSAACAERANALGAEQGGEDQDDDWCVTHKDHKVVEAGDLPTMGSAEAAPADDDIPDIDEVGDVGVVGEDDDPAAGAAASTLACRTYDLHILYDDYHGTPRVYLMGYDEQQRPLGKEQMFEDIYSDYADKTATMEKHPFTGTQMASIHPCRHAETMKRMIDVIKDQHREAAAARGDAAGAEFGMRPEMALFLFLKFINSVVPTIDFDYTMDVQMGG